MLLIVWINDINIIDVIIFILADKLFDVRLSLLSEWSCKLLKWCRYSSETSNDWLLVFMCINRIAAISWPTHLQVLTTVRASIVGIILSVAVSCSLNSIVISSYSLIEWRSSNRSNVTFLSCSTVEVANKGHFFVLFFEWLFPIIPHAIMFAASSFLCFRLVAIAYKRNARRRMSKQRGSIQVHLVKTQKELQLAVAFMTMTIVDFVFDGTTAFLNSLLVMIASTDLTFDNRPQTLRDVTYKMQDASMLLRIWNLYAYLLIMPSFRYALFKFFTRSTRLKGNQHTSLLKSSNSPNERGESIVGQQRVSLK